jgi:hypothetical protein
MRLRRPVGRSRRRRSTSVLAVAGEPAKGSANDDRDSDREAVRLAVLVSAPGATRRRPRAWFARAQQASDDDRRRPSMVASLGPMHPPANSSADRRLAWMLGSLAALALLLLELFVALRIGPDARQDRGDDCSCGE